MSCNRQFLWPTVEKSGFDLEMKLKSPGAVIGKVGEGIKSCSIRGKVD